MPVATSLPHTVPATRTRYRVVAMAGALAMVTYLDRACIGTLAPHIMRDLSLTKRVVAIPGDQVEARDGNVYVNGFKIDDIETKPFPRVEVGSDEYFVLGDNRSFSQDSRDFGAVPRDAIFGRVFMVYWPLGDLGSPEIRHEGPPPGEGLCD